MTANLLSAHDAAIHFHCSRLPTCPCVVGNEPEQHRLRARLPAHNRVIPWHVCGGADHGCGGGHRYNTAKCVVPLRFPFRVWANRDVPDIGARMVYPRSTVDEGTAHKRDASSILPRMGVTRDCLHLHWEVQAHRIAIGPLSPDTGVASRSRSICRESVHVERNRRFSSPTGHTQKQRPRPCGRVDHGERDLSLPVIGGLYPQRRRSPRYRHSHRARGKEVYPYSLI